MRAHIVNFHVPAADVYRALFKFGVFNAVQSTCYDKVTPTGSGKTALFELAIIRMLMESSNSGRQSKCIYVAPTKALCSEKHRDWTIKFQALGVNCCELTGDTVQFGRSAWGEAKNAAIIVTTGEKWDSLTRNWEEHQQILSQITLFLIDEIHILNETRGSTLEVVVSRMKLRGTSVRFVAVSATVPNVQDVAAWLGNERNGGSAVIMEFGEEYRPCKIVRHVVPVLKKRDQNDFQFQRILDYKLYGVLQQYSQDKPVLIFCATRKGNLMMTYVGVVASAEQLMKEYGQSLNKRDRLPWTKPGGFTTNFSASWLAICGIGIHHAGLTWDDRRAMEDLFLKKVLRVIVATSTLAVGVNLPAHTVIIKGVKIFATDGWQEYSDLDIMQMMGRAGRPQFDKEGVAIIMCETELEAKYQALVQGRTFLESCLHNNLAEHINSEIGLGTITNINSAKEWLHSSFLFQRIQQNPRHYAIGKEGNQTWQERIDNMVTESIERLRENQLVELSNDDSSILKSTEYGDIMSKYYIRQSTVRLMRFSSTYLALHCSLISRFGPARNRFIYGKLKAHDEIRFKMKKVEKALDKISLIIQAVLAGLSLNDGEYKNGDNQPSLEAVTIWRHVSRIARAMVEVAIARQCGAQVKHGMELIELLNRRPTFGHEVLAFVKSLPEYYIQVEEVGTTLSDGASPVEIELSVTVGVNEDTGVDSGKFKKGKAKLRDSTTILSLNSELDFIDFRRISTKMLKPPKTFTITAHLTKPSQSVIVQIASETIAGVAVTYTYKPKLAYRAYPTMITRPQTTLERDLEGIEDDAAFWEAMKDWPSDDEEVVKKDLTRKWTAICVHRILMLSSNTFVFQRSFSTEQAQYNLEASFKPKSERGPERRD
ncbi:uncharacterized protein PHACADRAFT_143494 [Phanerochaete carnosa HHB-10118-sp]|uniref:DNA 3'-5' helicase n=1 Tax=Phanerochaete carnosa (strain HHB-10118-sp) TaxID=650164 RepID=K5WXX8_PHACS|nr:uncharacterized protein PHACADRAFT_143494 [Phanerochaete carnosa HHB-10118-sp]EKM55317.1 hypothetical protein PHACADRAFT_143494 [Phanerochaete carnosa HHB-10118-sp]